MLAHECGELVVEAVGVADGPHSGIFMDAPALLVRARQTDDGPPPLPRDATQPAWLLLLPRDQRAASAIAALLTAEPLGPIDRRVLEIEWTFSPYGEEFVTARVEIGGEFALRFGERMLDEATAERLLASPRAITNSGLAAAGWSAHVDVAERVDWRILLPFERDGRGLVLGGILPEQNSDDTVELLVRVGFGSECRYLRVPAAVAPLFSAVRRESTLLSDRYLLQIDCAARILAAPVPEVVMDRPRRSTAIMFTSVIEGMRPRTSLLVKVLLSPLAACADASWWVLEHGPVDLRALTGCEQQPMVGFRPSRSDSR